MAITSTRGGCRTASPLSKSPSPRSAWPTADSPDGSRVRRHGRPATDAEIVEAVRRSDSLELVSTRELEAAIDAEIVAAVAKSRDLALVTEKELLEAIDATRVAGLVSEHELDLVSWTLTEGGGV